MSLHENESDKKDSLRNKVLGLGERSIKKNYYSELQSGIEELKRFRNLLDKVNDGILIGRISDGEIIDANAIAKKTFFADLGFENTQKKKKLQDVIGEKSYEDLSSFFSNQKGSDIDDKKNIFRKEIAVDSNRFEFSASANNYDGEIFFTSIFHDITERFKAESALKDSEKYLKTVLDSLSDAVFIHDFENYRIIDVNKRMLEMYGYTREEALQKTVEDISAAKESFDQKKAIARLENAKLNGGETFEWLAKRKDDSIFWAEVSVRFVEFGEKKYFLALVRDISERKKEQEEKIKFEQQLLHTQKLESLGILAGGIAHDFNNILTAVLGYTELAILQIDDSSSTLNFLKEIKNAIQKAAELSRQMLAYSGKSKFIVEDINLNILISQMLDLLKVSISKKIVLNLCLDEDIPTIEGGASQIRQVVMNLITNASESMGDNNGFITISTGSLYVDKNYQNNLLFQEELAVGNYVYFDVSDTGCGMDKETVKKIFDPFFTTKFSGRGLGMSAILGIVKSHKGNIRIYSEPGKGTCFRIILPSSDCLRNSNSKRENSQDDERLRFNGKVLIVDDENGVLNIGEEYLKIMGFDVVLASNGQEATAIFKKIKNKLKLVILDLTMPHMNGAETFDKIKKLNPDIKVVLMSGFAEDDLSGRFGDKGFSGFIQKPFTFDEFQEKIAQAIR